MILQFVRTNIFSKKLRSFLTVFSIAISVLLIVAIVNISSQLTDNIVENAQHYDILIGAKGSSTQLILNTLFFYDTPLGNIDKSYIDALKKDPNINTVVPIAMGDNYNGYKIVGTTPDYFKEAMFSVAKGSIFSEEKQVVIGSTVANVTGLAIGDEFSGSHGIGGFEGEDAGIHDEHHANFKYKVVGILKSTRTPNDMAIFTPMESVWNVHGIEEHTDELHEEVTGHEEEGLHEEDKLHEEEENHEEDEQHEEDEHHDDKTVTCILVKSKGFAEAFTITQLYNAKSDVQAINPAATLRKLLSTISIGEKVASLIAYISVILSVITLFIVMLSASTERRKDIAVLRTLGANRKTVFNIIMLETVVISVIGSLLGILLAHSFVYVLGGIAASKLGIYISAASITSPELFIVAVSIVLSTIAGVIPGVMVYRTDVTKYLK